MRHEHRGLTEGRAFSPDEAEEVLSDEVIEALSDLRAGEQPNESDRTVFSIVAGFRSHPHISNVMTHISGGRWDKVEAALKELVEPTVRSASLSPLARNMVDLCCAQRGVTGRLAKPVWEDLLAAVAGRRQARRISAIMRAHFLNLNDAESAQAAARHCSRWP